MPFYTTPSCNGEFYQFPHIYTVAVSWADLHLGGAMNENPAEGSAAFMSWQEEPKEGVPDDAG